MAAGAQRKAEVEMRPRVIRCSLGRLPYIGDGQRRAIKLQRQQAKTMQRVSVIRLFIENIPVATLCLDEAASLVVARRTLKRLGEPA